jgi:hypothetical protein
LGVLPVLGSSETVANAILRLSSQLDLMGLAMIFKLGAMPYDMVERSMSAFGEEVVPRIRRVLDRDAAANHAAAAPTLQIAYKVMETVVLEMVRDGRGGAGPGASARQGSRRGLYRDGQPPDHSLILATSPWVAYRSTGAEIWMPHFIALLARACEIAGQVEGGLTLLDEACRPCHNLTIEVGPPSPANAFFHGLDPNLPFMSSAAGGRVGWEADTSSFGVKPSLITR